MEDFNKKATKEIADMMHYVAEDVVDTASYDVTRNARVTKVYTDWYGNTEYIIGYDINVDGRNYHLTKERGKGVIASENDIVKLHFPCNNPNYMYLSYAHDPEDFIIKYEGTHYGYIQYYYSGHKRVVTSLQTTEFTFPSTTKQFSKVISGIDAEESGIELGEMSKYAFTVMADNDVWGTVNNYNGDSLGVTLYNENPTTTNPVTKNVNVRIIGERYYK